MPRKLTIQHARDFAESKGWECLSDIYINALSHLKWRCSENHKWNASFNNVKNSGTGCPKCNILSFIGNKWSEVFDFTPSED